MSCSTVACTKQRSSPCDVHHGLLLNVNKDPFSVALNTVLHFRLELVEEVRRAAATTTPTG
jgi:hypothetical protein